MMFFKQFYVIYNGLIRVNITSKWCNLCLNKRLFSITNPASDKEKSEQGLGIKGCDVPDDKYENNQSEIKPIINNEHDLHFTKESDINPSEPQHGEPLVALKVAPSNPPPPEPPVTCCMSGCANCVWIDYAEELKAYYGAFEGTEKAKKALDNIEDPSLKAFLKLELGIR